MKKVAFTIVFILLFADFADAQSFYSRRRDRKWMFSFGIGASTYHGDLHDVFYDGLSSAIGPTLGVGLRRKFGSQLSVRLDLNYYQIGGSDADNGRLAGRDPSQRGGPREGQNDSRAGRFLSFSASNIEGALMFTFNLIPVNGSYTRRPILNPYIMLGLGFTTNNPKGDHPEAGVVNLRHLNTEALPGVGYGATVMTIPFGVGIRLKANQYIDILLEAGRRIVFTDYLDDVSTQYVSQETLLAADRIGSVEDALRFYDRSQEAPQEFRIAPRQEGDTRGNPEKNDAYYIFQVRLEMYLPDNFIQQLFSPSRRKPKFR